MPTIGRVAGSDSGLALHFPAIDADVYLPGLVQGLTGSKSWMAAQMGARGGKAVSHNKASAARNNGKLGGRPRKLSQAA
ncbi:hypothetical protein BH09PSE5_BH09PSE5_06210 [soil metagenome]